MKKIMFNDRYGLTQAVIEGRKTMTRRIMNPQPKDCTPSHKNYWGADWSDAPMALALDRKTGGVFCRYCGNGVRWFDGGYFYKSKYKVGEEVAVAQGYESIYNELWIVDKYEASRYAALRERPGWRNKMFVGADLMSHRIRITDIRCERLQDIPDEDCMREGVQYLEEIEQYYFGRTDRVEGFYFNSPREAFAELIDKVSGKGTWDSDPWVFVYGFELVK